MNPEKHEKQSWSIKFNVISTVWAQFAIFIWFCGQSLATALKFVQIWYHLGWKNIEIKIASKSQVDISDIEKSKIIVGVYLYQLLYWTQKSGELAKSWFFWYVECY